MTDESENGSGQVRDAEPQPPIGMANPVLDRLASVHETVRALLTRRLDSTHRESRPNGVDRTTDRRG